MFDDLKQAMDEWVNDPAPRPQYPITKREAWLTLALVLVSLALIGAILLLR